VKMYGIQTMKLEILGTFLQRGEEEKTKENEKVQP